MPQPGWYDDPDGTPQRLRWWDGTRWTQHIHGAAQPGPSAANTTVAVEQRGIWPWVALGLVVALLGAMAFGLVMGMISFRDPQRGTPGPAMPPGPTPTSATETTPGPSRPTPTPPLSTLPSITAQPGRTGGPIVTPTPMPSIPATPHQPVDLGCPPAVDGASTLSDGQVVLTIPSDWRPVDSLTWLACSRAAVSTSAMASITLGVSAFPAGSLQEAAEQAWTVALLDAAIARPVTLTSTPVEVADMDGWMVTGTVAIEGELNELTVIALTAGDQPTIVVTLADTHDPTSRAMVSEILATVRPA